MKVDLASLDKNFCTQKVDSAIALIDRLLDGDHPHGDSQRALALLKAVYEGDRALLDSLDDTAQNDTVLEVCRRANVNLVKLKAFVGFLLRSTNIRNAFEFYFPIRLLATEFLGKTAPVVLGSEWNFSPYTYPAALDELPDFIFIGIPASESQNPLILPLAGHELGHVVWRRKGAQIEFDKKIQERVLALYKANWDEFKKLFGLPLKLNMADLETDLFLRGVWAKSYDLARRQLEEIFCDFAGVYTFGPSFLHSFRYLLAPSLGEIRSYMYPRIQERAKFMADYANSIGVPPIDKFADAFSEADPRFPPTEAFVLKMADETTRALHGELPALVEKYKGKASRFDSGGPEQELAKNCLWSLVPPNHVNSVAAIVNAAWDIRLHIDTWNILGDIETVSERNVDKLRVLTDLVLKSFEVFEFQKRVAGHAS